MKKMKIKFDEYKIPMPDFRTSAGLVMTMLLTVGVHPPLLAKPPAWQPMSQGVNDARMAVVAVDPNNPRLLYAGSLRAVYTSHDGGLQWRERFRLPAQAELMDLAIDPFDRRHVLAATTHGLYGTSDGGRGWTRFFRGSGAGESRCQVVLFHPAHRHEVLLGTAGGLFASMDGGRRWRTLGSRLSDRSVHDLAVDPQQPQRIYALTDQGLFVSGESPEAWNRIFEVSQAEGASPEEVEELPEEPEQESEFSRQPTALAIDPHDPKQLYVATTDGLFVSQDGGVSWQRATQLGLGTAQIHHLILHAHSPVVAYAATPQGVARYLSRDARWEVLYMGLPTQAVRWLAATESRIFAATDQGLYALDLTEEQLAQGNWPSAREILGNFVHEPTIAQVQESAMHYAEVEPEKIQRWRRQAYLKAFFPTVSFDYDRDEDTFLNAIGSTTNPAFDRIVRSEDPSKSLDFSLNWDIGDLIWSTDQTSIDVRSKLMVQLRDDILDEVTRHFFERRRLQVELLTDPPSDSRAQLDKELRLQELTAMLDGLTGGWFSHEVETYGTK